MRITHNETRQIQNGSTDLAPAPRTIGEALAAVYRLERKA